MNNIQKFSIVLGCFFLAQNHFVNSQHPAPTISEQLQRLQQKQEHKETEEIPAASKKTQETVRMAPYAYRAQATPTNGYYPGYPRDLYQPVATSPPVASSKGNLIQMATGGDYFLTAHINQIFYSFVGISVGIACLIFVIKYLGYAFDISGMFQKIKNGTSSGKEGKALDLNHFTNMLYGALENYGKNDKDE